MATGILLVRDKNRLAPYEPWSAEWLDSVPNGEVLMAKITRPRHPRHHKKLFVLLHAIVKGTDKYFDEEDLLDDIKIAMGHCRICTRADGSTFPRPKSISFANMNQPRFKKFYDAAVRVIVTEILPGIDKDDLEREVLEMIEPRNQQEQHNGNP